MVANIEEYIRRHGWRRDKAALREKIDGLQRSLETHMKNQTWVISIIGFTIVALTATGTLVSILRH